MLVILKRIGYNNEISDKGVAKKMTVFTMNIEYEKF